LPGLFRCGFLLALRKAAKLGQDALHAPAGGVMAGVKIPRVHPA
jgi:hypothetical protein